MNPKYWWPLSIVFVVAISILVEFMESDRFDPESLPTPAAGTATVTTRTQNICDDVIYSISQDGIKYVRESGGGILLAAELGNRIGFYHLGSFGELENVDKAELDTAAPHLLEYALTNCDARYNPSGVIFALG